MQSSRSAAGLPLAVATAILALALALVQVLSADVLVVERVPPEAVAAILAMLAVAAAFGLLVLRERRRLRQARRSALLDSLTGVANRLAFEERLRGEWQRAFRHDRPLGIIVLDVDGLKEVNDTLGHPAGDDALRRVGSVLSDRIRGSDFAARIGGDEFVVLTAETGAGGLEALAASLREALAELPVAVSVGWAERTDRDRSPAELLQRADLAMYRDKGHRRLAGRLPGASASGQPVPP